MFYKFGRKVYQSPPSPLTPTVVPTDHVGITAGVKTTTSAGPLTNSESHSA